MKKLFISITIGVIFISAPLSYVRAQLFASLSAPKIESYLASESIEVEPAGTDSARIDKTAFNSAKKNLKSSKAELRAMKANLRAVTDFQKHFTDGPDVKWVKEQEVYHAIFNRDNKQTHVIYNLKGFWLHTMIFYKEDQMPTDVYHAVRHEYPDYSINATQEIREGEEVFYIVHVEDSRCFKNLVVYNNEVSERETINK